MDPNQTQPLRPQAAEAATQAPRTWHAPVLTPLGSLQALTAIKHIAQLGPPQAGKLFHFDMLTMRTRLMTPSRNSDCPLCGASPTITGLCPESYRRK